MKTWMHPISAAAVLCLCLAVSQTSHASCESNKRVSLSSAGCLSGEYENKTRNWGLTKSSSFSAQNTCFDWGKVVAKIDIKVESDKTWHLTDGLERTGTANNHVRSITCCSDLSKLCSKTDLLTVDGCTARFEESPADDDCDPVAGGVSVSVADERCTIIASCGGTANHTITAEYEHLDEVSFCNGELQVTGCPQ